MTTTICTTYRIEYRDGWSANSHFGREIMSRVLASGNEYATLADARMALRQHRSEHGGTQPGRFDIVGNNGRRYSWE